MALTSYSVAFPSVYIHTSILTCNYTGVSWSAVSWNHNQPRKMHNIAADAIPGANPLPYDPFGLGPCLVALWVWGLARWNRSPYAPFWVRGECCNSQPLEGLAGMATREGCLALRANGLQEIWKPGAPLPSSRTPHKCHGLQEARHLEHKAVTRSSRREACLTLQAQTRPTPESSPLGCLLNQWATHRCGVAPEKKKTPLTSKLFERTGHLAQHKAPRLRGGSSWRGAPGIPRYACR